MLISALFTIPIAFLMYQWLTQLGSRLDVADRERSGLEYVMSLASSHGATGADARPAAAGRDR